ncbi:DNA/RNA non-specific endonuclease [Novosphingopyxis sp.]|uniref:DNA/RNA non-specific endonuclease n=1 Tax=Novosphingopyxis sp. TaxID=2709690 RepID=UPI003B5CAB89
MIDMRIGICTVNRLRLGILLAATFGLAASPALAADGELHSFHCLFGCPLGAPATNDTIVREIYTLSSDDLTKVADWVAYRITPASIGPSGDRVWQADPWLSVDETLTPHAYDGANRALHIDRGHQAPLASFSGTPFADETNFLSNITPQSSALNQGAWSALEAQERLLARRFNTAVYVYTGPLFERLMAPLPSEPALHRVPSGYWKVIALADGRISAFIFDQTASRAMPYCDGRVPLEQVVLRSRLQLFPMADLSRFTNLDGELGCHTPLPPVESPAVIPGN